MLNARDPSDKYWLDARANVTCGPLEYPPATAAAGPLYAVNTDQDVNIHDASADCSASSAALAYSTFVAPSPSCSCVASAYSTLAFP